jgi:hypothetical protein
MMKTGVPMQTNRADESLHLQGSKIESGNCRWQKKWPMRERQLTISL